MRRAPWTWLSPLALLALAGGPACSCDDGTTPIPPLGEDARAGTGDGAVPGGDAGPTPTGHTRLRLEPASVRLVSDGTTPARQSFRALARKADGTEEDVTARATYALGASAVGTLSGADYASTRAGNDTLTASFATLTATASIEVVAERVIVGPGVPAGAPQVFMTAPEDAARAPTLVYPNDGVLLPPNLGGLEIHWRRARPSDDLFEVELSSTRGRIVAYVRCTPLADGCLYTPDAATWQLLAESHRGGPDVSVRVRETDDAGTGVGRSASVRVSFSAFPVVGGLYYWTTSNGTAIMRVDFGAQTPPERFFPFQGGGCYGCHALSRNGRKMTLSRDGQNNGQIRGIDVAARTIIFGQDDQAREQFQSWNPTSDRFVGMYGDREEGRNDLRIRDGDDGRVLETIALGVEPTHPDWSPLGDRIVFTWVTIHGTSQRPGRGAIAYVRQEGPGWTAPQTLVPAEDTYNRYYPAYSPDGAFVVYDESRCGGGRNYGDECDGDADDSARLWAIATEGGARVELARANAPGVADGARTELANTYPKWAPFVDPRTRAGGDRVMWMTFSSRRSYGLRAPSGSNQQLWMVAVDPDAIMRGQDGSFAAFALPFQDLGTSNHVAQWAAQIVPPTDTDGGVSDGGGADGGMCAGVGDPCDDTTRRCCSGLICMPQGGGVSLCRPGV